jgi:cardiolipin synthase
MNIANFITLGRLLLVPVTVWLIISDAHKAAFLAFVVAGVSDWVDGYLARNHGMGTEIGAYLDPVADKALLVSVYVTLGFLKEIPPWLVILVVSRDVLIVVAVLVSWLMNQPMRMAPLMIGKISTAGHIVFVVGVLGFQALSWPLAAMVEYGSIVVGGLTAASGAAYLFTWIRHMGETVPEEHKP